MSKGMEAYKSENFSSALAYFQVVIEEAGGRTDALFYAGESARRMRSYNLAEKYLTDIPEEERREDFALTNYCLGLTKKSLEKFDEAIALFQQFANERHDISDYRQKALNEIKNCEWAKEMMKKPSKVELVHINEAVNSIYSDYAPVAIGDTLYYTSTAQVKVDLSKKKKKKAGKPGSKKKKSKKVKEVLVTKIFRSVNGLTGEPIRQNSRDVNAFTANLAFNYAGNRMYYTVCDQLDEKKNIFRCELYYRDRQGNDDWGRAVRLSDDINMAGTNSTQPCIAYDAATKQETLIFASDRPGGKGKLDLWSSTLKSNGEFAAPINIAALNTEEDDFSPFFETDSKTLYFSSDGYQNFGGYDLFKSIKGEKDWEAPENLGYPINSSYDDAFYYVDKTTGKTYLASNRAGAFCVSPDKDCNLHDIYSLTNSAEILVSAFNEKDFSMIYGATLTLEDLTNGRKETIQMSPEEYKATLLVHPQHNHRLTITKDGYEEGSADIFPKDVSGENPKKYVFMKPWTQLVVRTLDANSKQPMNGMSIRVTDLKENKSKTYHLPSDKAEYSLPVKTDREYEVVAIKSGFDAVVDKVNFAGLKNEATITKDLFMKPFFGGLPLTIYFDNDEPKETPGAHPTACTLTYEQAYQDYMGKKGEFIEQFSNGMMGTDKEIAKLEAARFFDSEIQSGYYDLLKLSENLLFALQNGEKIELHIEGYASPLADDHYNEQLAERRIQTILNHFHTYKEGALTKYTGSSLTIKRIPYGEKEVSDDVSDSKDDRRSSVYSPKASKERRVIIGGFRTPANNVSTSLK
jgi:tetratricopeptide (TPR) repeat protein